LRIICAVMSSEADKSHKGSPKSLRMRVAWSRVWRFQVRVDHGHVTLPRVLADWSAG
jgi:hypothetical protein